MIVFTVAVNVLTLSLRYTLIKNHLIIRVTILKIKSKFYFVTCLSKSERVKQE